MPTHNKLLIAALCLPLALGACSDPDSGSPGTSPTSPGPSGTAKASAKPSPTGIPIATVYQATVKKGVSDEDVQAAVDRIGKLPGVQGAVVNKERRQVRVDLSAINITKNAPAVYRELAKLGEVKAI